MPLAQSFDMLQQQLNYFTSELDPVASAEVQKEQIQDDLNVIRTRGFAVCSKAEYRAETRYSFEDLMAHMVLS